MFSQEKQQNVSVIPIINITKAFVTLKTHCVGQNKTNHSYQRLESQEGGDISPTDKHSLLHPNRPTYIWVYELDPLITLSSECLI